MTFIWRVIDSGMVSLTDVTSGKVTLAELAEAGHYLDMKSDIEYDAMETARKKAKYGSRRSR